MTKGTLSVIIVEAKKLKDEDGLGKSDPYVEVYLNKHYKQKTSTKSNTLAPTWNETFNFNIDGEKSLHLKVLDKDVVSDDEIGEAKIDLTPVFTSGYSDAWHKLPVTLGLRSHGEVHVILQFSATK